MKANNSVVRNPFFTLLISRNPKHEPSRMGIVVGRRVGKAVKRNRLKRIFRELVRSTSSGMAGGYHCIVYPKYSVLQASYQDVARSWKSTLADKGLLSQ